MNHGLNPKYVYTQIIPFYTLGQLLISWLDTEQCGRVVEYTLQYM